MKIYEKSMDWLVKQHSNYVQKLALINEGEAKELAKQGLAMIEAEIKRRQLGEKKSESQPSKNAGQPQRTPIRNAAAKVPQEIKDEVEEWAEKTEKEAKWQEIREKLPAMARAYDETVKTVKAPEFSVPDELINIELEDSKGNKQVKTFSKAQVRALARKYFSNVHESWLGKERKMGVGFKNLLAYVVAWKEFDGEIPQQSQILPYYDRYKQGEKASDAFKVAQELYDKIVEILQA